MKTLNHLCLTLLLALPILFTQSASALEWPQEVVGDTGRIILYQPQPENLKGNRLTGRAAMALVLDDSEPRYSPIENSDYERVINAPIVVVKDKRGTHYVTNGKLWYHSSSAMGPWEITKSPPRQPLQPPAEPCSQGRLRGGEARPKARYPGLPETLKSRPAEAGHPADFDRRHEMDSSMRARNSGAMHERSRPVPHQSRGNRSFRR